MSFHVHAVPGEGAEDVVVGLSGRHEGAVFTGTDDGSIFRISHDTQRIDRVAHTGGRPLGIEADLDGGLLVCDARRGVLRVDPDSGLVEAVTDRVDGVRMVFCNNAAIASSGEVWFSDSSTKFGIEQWKDDFVQNTRTGRLLRLDESGDVEVVLDGLAFANGSRWPRTSRSSPWPRRARAPSYATGSPVTGRGSATTWSRASPATPTTSRAARTG